MCHRKGTWNVLNQATFFWTIHRYPYTDICVVTATMSQKFKSCSLFFLSQETKRPALWHNSTDKGERLCNQSSPLYSHARLQWYMDYEKQENLLLELPLPVIQGTHLSCLEPARDTMEVECMLKPMQPWKSTQNTSNVKIRQDMSQSNTVFKEHERHILSSKTLK